MLAPLPFTSIPWPPATAVPSAVVVASVAGLVACTTRREDDPLDGGIG